MRNLLYKLAADAIDPEELHEALKEEITNRFDYPGLAERLLDEYEDQLFDAMVKAAEEYAPLCP